jgi:hypothetical protein
MRRTLYLLSIFACQPITAQDNKQMAQQIIQQIHTSDLASWKALANILSVTFEESSSDSTSDDHYNSARKKALHWLSTDEYAISLVNNTSSNTDEESDKKQMRLVQRYALATIYYGTSQTGEWNQCAPLSSSTSTPCDNDKHRYLSSSNHLLWDGINGKSGLVTWLDLNGKNLSNNDPSIQQQQQQYDMLPMELTLLSPSLELLWIHSNPLLFGTIPPHIGEFINLQSLSIYSTNVGGVIPPTLYEIEKLSSIRLYKSKFVGEISKDVTKLKNLKWLWIHENRFTGVLPDLGGLTLLEGITLHGNQFEEETTMSGLCGLLRGNLKYLWTNCNDGSAVKKGGEWMVVDGTKACECCTRCFPRKEVDAVSSS